MDVESVSPAECKDLAFIARVICDVFAWKKYAGVVVGAAG
jgi:hypothetical protein